MEQIENKTPGGKIISLFSHILNAQHIWTHRVMKKEIVHETWKAHAIEQMPELLKENEAYIQFVHSNFGNEQLIEYTNSSGTKFQSQIKDILYHVFNHGNYHRGQINLIWRKQNLDPPIMDFIHWKRNEKEN